ncbi:MAG: hypothetical protein EHM59_11550, partial [Betaproteobacteria bacterium]
MIHPLREPSPAHEKYSHLSATGSINSADGNPCSNWHAKPLGFRRRTFNPECALLPIASLDSAMSNAAKHPGSSVRVTPLSVRCAERWLRRAIVKRDRSTHSMVVASAHAGSPDRGKLSARLRRRQPAARPTQFEHEDAIMSDETLRRLTTYASKLGFEDLPPETVHQVKRLMVDSLGCAIGAFTSEPAKAARDLASCVTGHAAATVIGTRDMTTPDLAAFANGTMVRYLDFNDAYGGKDTSHPTDNFPIVLAAAEAYDASGRDLITGIVLAYEVQTAFSDT